MSRCASLRGRNEHQDHQAHEGHQENFAFVSFVTFVSFVLGFLVGRRARRVRPLTPCLIPGGYVTSFHRKFPLLTAPRPDGRAASTRTDGCVPASGGHAFH